MRITSGIFCLLLCVNFSCREFVAGQKIIFGNLYKGDCNLPLPGMKVVLVDSKLMNEPCTECAFKIDSFYTDLDGRFEFFHFHIPENELGLIVELEDTIVVYQLSLPFAVYQEIEICTDL